MSPRWLLPLALAAAALGCNQEAPYPRDAREAGWIARFDDFETDADANRFVEHRDNLEVKHGSNVTLWHPRYETSGDYRLSVAVTHRDSGLHPHGAGLTFGGRDVQAQGQRYTYFLVRNDRHFLIKTRTGEESQDIVSWTEHDAVSPEQADGVMTNELTVEVQGDEVRFMVNGTQVHRQARKDLFADGLHGVRLVHDLHVRFGNPVVVTL
ncbi:MAG: hypothetical protein VYE77_10465 [Planctomycetota bacterium]|nr:hypothetical protein [Planctomycetota bacterium]